MPTFWLQSRVRHQQWWINFPHVLAKNKQNRIKWIQNTKVIEFISFSGCIYFLDRLTSLWNWPISVRFELFYGFFLLYFKWNNGLQLAHAYLSCYQCVSVSILLFFFDCRVHFVAIFFRFDLNSRSISSPYVVNVVAAPIFVYFFVSFV